MTEPKPSSDNFLYGPGGRRHASLFTHVKPDQMIEVVEGRWHIVDSHTRAVIKDISHSAPLEISAKSGLKPDNSGPGWIAAARHNFNAGEVLSSISTNWQVPPAPTNPNGGEVVFLFNGFQNNVTSSVPSLSGTHIFQPVLQWGSGSAAGGGSYWAVASWYAGNQTQPAQFTNLTQVNVGDILTGVITLTKQQNGKYTYSCEFVGLPDSKLSVTLDKPPFQVVETLECYGTDSRDSYPAAQCTSMYHIAVQVGGSAITPNWVASNAVPPVGIHTDVSPMEVDLWYGPESLPSRVGGVFRASAGAHKLVLDDSYAYFNEYRLSELSSQGYLPAQVFSNISATGERLYGGLFHPGTGAWEIAWGDSYDYFSKTRLSEIKSKGLHPVQVWITPSNRYGGLFRSGTPAWEIVYSDSYNYFHDTRIPALTKKGLVPAQIWISADGQRFGGLFIASSDAWEIVYSDSYDYFQNTRVPDLTKKGLRPVQIWRTPDGQRFGGLFRSGSDAWEYLWGDSFDYFTKTRLPELTAKNLHPLSMLFNPPAIA